MASCREIVEKGTIQLLLLALIATTRCPGRSQFVQGNACLSPNRSERLSRDANQSDHTSQHQRNPSKRLFKVWLV